jgi:hypothetical protein
MKKSSKKVSGYKYLINVKDGGDGVCRSSYAQLRIYFPGKFVAAYDASSAQDKMDFFSTDPDVLERSKCIVRKRGNLTQAERNAGDLGPVEVDEAVIDEILFRHKKSEEVEVALKSANRALELTVTLNLLRP